MNGLPCGMVHLLENPQGLDDGSILRLYETSAYLFGRMECYGDAFDQLKQMKAYLLRHPSAFYLVRLSPGDGGSHP